MNFRDLAATSTDPYDGTTLKELLDKLYQCYPPGSFDDPIYQNLLSNKDFVAQLVPILSYGHVVATPLVEVFSVSICSYHIDGGGMVPYEIYGTIKVIDGEGATFNLYDRKKDKPETVPIGGGALTLTVPKGCAITPCNVVKLEIDLKDRARGDNFEIVKGSLHWDYTIKDDYDSVITEVVDGVHGVAAAVQYITYSHAVIATVQVILDKGKVDDGSCSDVYGRIVARYGNHNSYSTILFDRKVNESVHVEYGTCIELSRHVVAVPAYSSLTIDTSLWDRDTQQQIITGQDTEFPACNYSGLNEDVEGQNGHLIQVQVDWNLPCMQPRPPRVEETSSGKNVDNMFQVIKNPGKFSIDYWKSFEEMDVQLMEVFSVSVGGGDNDENFSVWGSIEAKYGYQSHVLFNRPKISPKRLFRNQTVPIESPPSKRLATCVFRMFLYLRDVNGRVISKGDISWTERTFKSSPVPWRNRRLSSVIRSDDGFYAAVHYSIFTSGVQATVKIYLKNDNKSCSSIESCKVDGIVCAQYSNYEYSTLYEKEYYRRKLFVRRVEDPSLHYNSDCNILLSESAVVVPEKSNLIVDVNLKVIDVPYEVKTTDGRMQGVATFVDLLEFEAGMDFVFVSPLEFEGTLPHIVVRVEWSEVSF